MNHNPNLPVHVGIIMDGNGRWAKAKGLPRIEGHRRGADKALDIIQAASEIGIKVLTLYTFSSENWQRPKKEISFLMKILETYLKRNIGKLMKNNIQYKAIGETWRLPENIQKCIQKAENETSPNTGMILVTALSYGGHNEILRALKKAISNGIDPKDLTEESFANLLDTAGLPPVDLIIRTSGEMRLSNFMLWQAAYAELYFTETNWPDFSEEELKAAIMAYNKRERRFGTVQAMKEKDN